MTEDREFEIQVEGLASDVLGLLVSEEGMSLGEAMNTLYMSRTFKLVERKETGMFYQSPVYVYDCLMREIGKEKRIKE